MPRSAFSFLQPTASKAGVTLLAYVALGFFEALLVFGVLVFVSPEAAGQVLRYSVFLRFGDWIGRFFPLSTSVQQLLSVVLQIVYVYVLVCVGFLLAARYLPKKKKK